MCIETEYFGEITKNDYYLYPMQPLHFPNYQFRFKNSENHRLIFDPIRKKFFVLTPEEWLRQHVIQFLIKDKGYSPGLMNVEKQLKLHATTKRYDLVVFNPDGSIEIIVECKAPNVAITQDTFDQIARYNLVTQATYLMVSNGLHHYYCQMNYELEQYQFLKELPKKN